MALGLTQPLTEMSTRNISWGKGGRCVGLTTLPASCADCLEIWEPQTPGTLRACPGLQWNFFSVYLYRYKVFGTEQAFSYDLRCNFETYIYCTVCNVDGSKICYVRDTKFLFRNLGHGRISMKIVRKLCTDECYQTCYLATLDIQD